MSKLRDMEESEVINRRLKAFELSSVDTSEREEDILSSLRYHDIKNIIGMEIQMQKRMEALEYIMEAYPSSYTLKEIKDQLECVLLKNDKEIRKLIIVK